jgi:hypothetical protein
MSRRRARRGRRVELLVELAVGGGHDDALGLVVGRGSLLAVICCRESIRVDQVG